MTDNRLNVLPIWFAKFEQKTKRTFYVESTISPTDRIGSALVELDYPRILGKTTTLMAHRRGSRYGGGKSWKDVWMYFPLFPSHKVGLEVEQNLYPAFYFIPKSNGYETGVVVNSREQKILITATREYNDISNIMFKHLAWSFSKGALHITWRGETLSFGTSLFDELKEWPLRSMFYCEDSFQEVDVWIPNQDS